MPETQQNITNIPSNRVEFIDSRTGLVSREWYRFFLNIFNLAGAGGNQTSLDDLQVGPPPQPVSTSGGGGTGTVTSVDMTVPTGLAVSGNPITTSGTLAVTYASGYAIPTTAKQTQWDTAYTNTLHWDGSATSLVAATGRTSLGGTTIGQNVFTLTNPSAITFPRFNADNTVSALDAASFRTAIGAGTGSGTVTSVTGTSPVVSSGGATPAISLDTAYGDTQNPYASKTANYFLAAPNGSSGVPTFRAMIAADVPTLNQNTTGTASNVTGTVAVANGGTGLTTTPTNGALDIGNGTGFTRTTLTAGTNVSITNASGAITINSTNPGGTVTSVAATVPSFLSVSGSPITSSGTLAISYSGTALPIANGGTAQTSFTSNYIHYGSFSTSASLQFDGTTMRVGANALLGGTTNPIVGVTGGASNYIQSYIYNATNGASSSADFVAYANNSTDAHGWADIGFTSQTYADATYTVTGPNEAYVFGSAPSGAGATGNLVFATDSTGSANAHQFYVGGFTQAKSAWRAQITSTLLQAKGTFQLMGSSSGYVGFTAAATAGSTTYTLPSADGTSGQALTTNGSGTLVWSTPSGSSNITAKGMWENALTISSNYSITSGNSAMSAGPITIAAGVSVTVPSGSRWVVV
jgi:hypothetical protein